nr:MAG TPA: hypothetical protein [Caudoviricetes sp.]
MKSIKFLLHTQNPKGQPFPICVCSTSKALFYAGLEGVGAVEINA